MHFIFKLVKPLLAASKNAFTNRPSQLFFYLSEATMLILDATFHGNSLAATHNYVLFQSQQVILDADIFRSFQQCFKS